MIPDEFSFPYPLGLKRDAASERDAERRLSYPNEGFYIIRRMGGTLAGLGLKRLDSIT